MKEIPSHIRTLIYKDLRGKTNAQEQQVLDSWFEENDHDLTSITPQSIQEIKARQKKQLKPYLGKQSSSISFTHLSGIAAVFVLFSLAALLYFLDHKNPATQLTEEIIAYQTITADYGQRKSILLSDGSTVKLFGPSTLSVHPDYPLERKTILTGEAFFDIKKDSLRPFLVETESFNLKVLGTSFLVKSDSSLTASVAIKSGLVNVSRGAEFSEDLHKNDFLTIEKHSSMLRKEVINPDYYFAKINNTLWYEKTPLSTVLKDLKDWYGLDELTIQAPIDHYFITGKFKNEPLKNIMESITYSTGIAYELTNKHLSIIEK